MLLMAHAPNDVAQRMAVLRFMIAGDNQTLFAKKIGIEVKRWNNFERGTPLSKEVAFTLVQKIHGLTLDWLHLGKWDGLPGRLRAELEDAEKDFASTKETTRKR